jgi:hypothetical protein
MDLADTASTAQVEASAEQALEAFPQSPRKLPDDLPTSLDDRRSFPSYGGETEMYDAWQGNSTCFPKTTAIDADGVMLPL